MSQLGTDSFVRADDPTGWDEASDAQDWAKVSGPSTPSISSNRGHLGDFNAYTIMALGAKTTADIDAEVSMVQGPSTLNEGGITWRIIDIDNNYRCLTFDNSVFIDKYVAGVHTQNIANAFIGFSNTDEMRMRVQHISDQLKIKFWKITDGEPADWDIEIIENSLTAAGQFGLFSDLAGGSGSGELQYWDFSVTDGNNGTDFVVSASDTSASTDHLHTGITTSRTGNAAGTEAHALISAIRAAHTSLATDTRHTALTLSHPGTAVASDRISFAPPVSTPKITMAWYTRDNQAVWVTRDNQAVWYTRG